MARIITTEPVTELLYYCPCSGGYVSSRKECECAPPGPTEPEKPGPGTTPITTPTVIGQPIVVPGQPAQPASGGSALPLIIGGAIVLWLLSK